jgi:RNA-binding protein YhbY
LVVAAAAAEPPPPAAAAAEPGDDPAATAAAGAWHAALPRPATRHQAPLSSKRRAELGAAAEGLARAKTLQRLQVGGKGVSLNTLHAAADALAKHEFLRVKLGEGCGLERRETAATLEQLLDAAVVRQVGFTITLYRQAGLPRPDSLAKDGEQQ